MWLLHSPCLTKPLYLNICYLYKNEVRIELNPKEPGMMIKMSMKEARAISLKFPFKHFTFWVVRDALAMGWGNLEILWLFYLLHLSRRARGEGISPGYL